MAVESVGCELVGKGNLEPTKDDLVKAKGECGVTPELRVVPAEEGYSEDLELEKTESKSESKVEPEVVEVDNEALGGLRCARAVVHSISGCRCVTFVIVSTLFQKTKGQQGRIGLVACA